jgi:hypothetical protein
MSGFTKNIPENGWITAMLEIFNTNPLNTLGNFFMRLAREQ